MVILFAVVMERAAIQGQNRLDCNAPAAHEWLRMPYSSFFSASPTSLPPRGTHDAKLPWRRNDFISYMVGHDEQVVMLRGETPHVLPGFVVDFVTSCEDFLPFDDHVLAYSDKHAWGPMETDALLAWLPKLQEARLLVSARDLLDACGRHPADAPPGINAIGFPTGGARQDLLARGLASFAANAKRHGRQTEFLIADSSLDPAHRAAFRAMASAKARECEVVVRYAGEEEKRGFAGELVRMGIAPDAVEFALFDPLGIGFACGANRNALLLHQAGRLFCSIDDDVICELFSPPMCGSKLKCFSTCDPFTRWIFEDRESSLEPAGRVDADFLASHEAILGHGLSHLATGVEVKCFDARQAGDDVLRRLWAGGGRVRASFSGHLGDPGIPTSVYYLYLDGENRRRLTSSEAHYRAAMRSRSVFALAPCAAIGDASTSPGMAMGLDHRELLPPFFPVLHAEDFIYGATLWQTVPGSFLGHVPMAVRHEPRPGKTLLLPGDLNAGCRAVIFEFAHLIRRIILHFQRAESASAEIRMDNLGRHLVALAEQPARDFQEHIRAQVIEHESAKMDHLDQELRDDGEAPEFWRQDLEAYLNHVRMALTHSDFDIPFDLKGGRSAEETRQLVQRLFLEYGRLLIAWPGMVAAAREIHSRREWMPRMDIS
jgi:hypothetical protein